jgi:hypothetical protein
MRYEVHPVCMDAGMSPEKLERYEWGDNEREEEGQPHCQERLARFLLPIQLEGDDLCLADVRNHELPALKAGKRKATGFSDIALGNGNSMSLPGIEDLMLSYV